MTGMTPMKKEMRAKMITLWGPRKNFWTGFSRENSSGGRGRTTPCARSTTGGSTVCEDGGEGEGEGGGGMLGD